MRRASLQIVGVLCLGLSLWGMPFFSHADSGLSVSAQVGDGTATAPEETPGVESVIRGGTNPTTASISISGLTSPGATVRSTTPGVTPRVVVAGADGVFSLVYDRLPFGEYVFSLSVTDSFGMSSTVTSVPVVLGNGVSATISGIVLGPTLSAVVSPNEPGKVHVSGTSAPYGIVTIWTDGFLDTPFTVRANAKGLYTCDLDFSTLASGVYRFRAKVSVSNVETPYGLPALVPLAAVGTTPSTPTTPVTTGPVCDVHAGDFNCDGLINLTDFSILKFWYQKPIPPLRLDLNNDGAVTLADMSLLSCAGLCQSVKGPQLLSLFVRPVQSSFLVSDRVAVDVLLDTHGAPVNAADVSVDFPETLVYDGSSNAGSILAAWIEEPHLSENHQSVLFSGMIPGSFSGYIDPFVPSVRRPGLLARLYFKATTPGTVPLTTSHITAYLADGKATRVPVDSVPGSVSIVSTTAASTPVLGVTDTTAPRQFIPRIVRDQLLYDGKYTLIFTTADGESGIDHYEVKEGTGPWVRAQSPYLLSDQRLTGSVSVRAVDHAGNTTTADAIIPAITKPVTTVVPADLVLRLKLFVTVCILVALILFRLLRTP